MKKQNIKNITKKLYLDPYQNQWRIYAENLNKSGIYCWLNLINNKIYVGSALNITKRISNYFSVLYLRRYLSKYKSHIYQSIVKYGYNNFSLHILEYCSKEELLVREQYYLDLLQPELNILKVAGSSLGYKFENKEKVLEDKAKTFGHKTIILNKQNLTINKFDTLKEAANYLNTNYKTIIRYIESGKLFKETYIIIRFIKLQELTFEFEKFKSINLVKPKRKTRSFWIELINLDTNLKYEFSSIRKACVFLNIDHRYPSRYLKEKGYYKYNNYKLIKQNRLI